MSKSLPTAWTKWQRLEALKLAELVLSSSIDKVTAMARLKEVCKNRGGKTEYHRSEGRYRSLLKWALQRLEQVPSIRDGQTYFFWGYL